MVPTKETETKSPLLVGKSSLFTNKVGNHQQHGKPDGETKWLNE
jgi:hypothetical protein